MYIHNVLFRLCSANAWGLNSCDSEYTVGGDGGKYSKGKSGFHKSLLNPNIEIGNVKKSKNNKIINSQQI